MIQEGKCIKFAPRVRDLDKQYEANNNAELDNGVQHDFGEDQNDVDVDFDDVVDGDDNLESDGDDGHLYKHIWSTICPIT